MWTLLISTVCCIGLGIFWMAVVQLAPLAMPKVAAAMAILGLLVITVFCFLVHNQYFFLYTGCLQTTTGRGT